MLMSPVRCITVLCTVLGTMAECPPSRPQQLAVKHSKHAAQTMRHWSEKWPWSMVPLCSAHYLPFPCKNVLTIAHRLAAEPTSARLLSEREYHARAILIQCRLQSFVLKIMGKYSLLKYLQIWISHHFSCSLFKKCSRKRNHFLSERKRAQELLHVK